MRSRSADFAIRGALAALAAGFALATAASPAAASPHECLPWSAETPRTSATCGAELVNGRAVAPSYAPPAVGRAIAFANHIRGRPYVWGGGHLRWQTRGYDCSGAVGFALHGAGLLDRTVVSGELMYWGEAGVGRWITVYANDDHTYMVVAGLRFDTRDDLPGVRGPRWHTELVGSKGFVARHPAGL